LAATNVRLSLRELLGLVACLAMGVLALNRSDIMRIGHSLWALILGYIGGHFARNIYARRCERERTEVGGVRQ
jgi:hypothetical protein